jgi:hypothetical protein
VTAQDRLQRSAGKGEADRLVRRFDDGQTVPVLADAAGTREIVGGHTAARDAEADHKSFSTLHIANCKMQIANLQFAFCNLQCFLDGA